MQIGIATRRSELQLADWDRNLQIEAATCILGLRLTERDYNSQIGTRLEPQLVDQDRNLEIGPAPCQRSGLRLIDGDCNLQIMYLTRSLGPQLGDGDHHI